MRIISSILLCGVLCVSAIADEAIPFEYDPITSADAARPVRVAMDGDVAAVIEIGHVRDGGGATNTIRTFYQTNTAQWIEVHMLPGSGYGLSVDVDDCRMAIGLVGTARVWSISCASSKPGWSIEQTLVFTNPSYRATGVVLDGNRLAVQVNNTDGGFLGGSQTSLYVYDFNGASWVFKKEIGIIVTNSLSLDTAFVAEAFDLEGDRIVVSSSLRGIIQVHEKNQGGTDNWGMVKKIETPPSGREGLGYSLALAGTRIAAAARETSSSQPCVLVYLKDTGGVDNWGYAGELIAPQADRSFLTLDSDNGRLAVYGMPMFDALAGLCAPASLWVYGPGGGVGGWGLDTMRELGVYRSSFQSLVSFSFLGGHILPNVSISDTRLMVGLPGVSANEDKSGWSLSFHSRNQGGSGNWGHETTLEPPGVPEEFGYSMKVDGSFMVVGMPFDNWAGTNSGSAYVWYLNSFGGEKVWMPVARLTKQSGQVNDLFGYSVDVEETGDGDARVAVGAYGEASGKGAVYLFDIDSDFGQARVERQIIPWPYTDIGAFGWSVALDGNYLAVGAPYSNLSTNNAGAVFIFDKDEGGTENWGCVRTNFPPTAGINFGIQLDMKSSALLVTRAYYPYNGVFVYKVNQGGTGNWGLFDTLLPPSEPFGFGWTASFGPNPGSLIVGDLGGLSIANGQAHIFAENAGGTGYQHFHTINDPFGDGSTFGSDVALSSTFAPVVGARSGGSNTGGVVRLFGLSTVGGITTAVQIAAVEGDAPYDRLGWQVESASFLYTVASAPRSDVNGNDAGEIKTLRIGSYEYWAADQPASFVSAWLPWENWDGDPDKNLMEFAMGTDPMNASDYSRLYMWPYYMESPVPMAWEKPDLPYSTLGLDYNMRIAEDVSDWNFVDYDSISTNGMTIRLYEAPGYLQQYRMEPRYPVFSSGGGGIIILD